jgi:hypothetical protein
VQLAEVPTAELWAEVRRQREKSPAIKAQIRLQLQRKHIRFLHALYADELPAYWETQAAGGPAAQQQFDVVDRRMRRARWDDMRWWTDIKAARPRGFGAESIEQVMRRPQAKHSSAQRQYSALGMKSDRRATWSENQSRADRMRGASIAEGSTQLAKRAGRRHHCRHIDGGFRDSRGIVASIGWRATDVRDPQGAAQARRGKSKGRGRSAPSTPGGW